MSVVGFNFTNVSVSVKKVPKGKFSVSPRVEIEDVSVQDFPMSKDGKQKVIVTKFTTGFAYEGGSEIAFKGTQLFLAPQEIADEVGTEYEKTKKLSPKVLPKIMSTIFARSQMKSVVLASEFGLPSPIPLPKLSIKPAEKKAE